jgi:hypothetical protein
MTARRHAWACLGALLAAAPAMFCAGCTTVGNGRLATLDAPASAALLVPGRTTEADVRAALGQGSVIRFESGVETWHYLYREGLSKGWDDVPYIGLVTRQLDRPTKELVLLFDAGGVLRRWSFQAHVPGATAPG